MGRGLRFVGGVLVSIAAAITIAVGVSAEQPPQARDNIYVVQLAGPVLDAWKAAIVAEGAELLDYVPQFAFRARMGGNVAARVRQLPFVSSVRPANATEKFSPRLARNGSRPYVVRLDRGADAQAVEAALRAAGVRVIRRGGTILVLADGNQLNGVAAVDGVAAISNFVPRIKHNEFGAGVIVGGNAANASGYDGSTQTIAIADTGLGMGTAAGAHAGIASSRIVSIANWPGTPDFCFDSITNDGAIDVDSGHGTHVATTALGAGNAAGVGRGTAPAANLFFQAIEDFAVPSYICSYLYGLFDGYYLVGLPGDIGDLFLEGYQAGARIHSNSWGAEVAGEYTQDSANADAFIWSHRDMTVTFSAGNSGVDADLDGEVDLESVNAPGTAKNVITIGASENDRQSHWDCDTSLTYTGCAIQGGQNDIFTWGGAWPDRYQVNPLRDDPSAGNAEQMAAFSSRGPTMDGRIKPDVVAPGTWILSGYSDAFQQQYDPSENPVNGLYQYDGWGYPLDASYKYMGGTSMANPLVAGGAAVVRDFYQKARGHNASAALVKAVLINTAVDLLDENNDGQLDNAYPIPNMHEGWGRIDLVNATDASDQFSDETTPLSTGGSTSLTFPVTSPGSPFKATLVWTDYPASTAASISLVNDLDLTVTAPDGTVYRGNVFDGGWSLPNGAADRLNNVENVYVFGASAGTWTVTVTGYNVPNGPQPFALVVDQPVVSSQPVVRLTLDDATATEAGPTNGTFRFTRSGDPSAALDVTYQVSGTATAGSDYVALSGSITFPADVTTVTLPIEAIDDTLFEGLENVIVSVTASPDYTVGSPSSGIVTLTSDDLPPDLRATGVSAPGYVAPGTSIVVTESTRNLGGGPAPPSSTGFYLSLDDELDESDVFVGSRAVGALAAGAIEAATPTLDIPLTMPAGQYVLIAQADWLDEVPESNEINNAYRKGYAWVGPDLMINAFTGPASAAAGQTISVTHTTKNLGAQLAPASVTGFYLSTNQTWDAADVWLGSKNIGALAGGGGLETYTTPLLLPVSTGAGSYYLLARADNGATVAEALENNNVRASGILRIGADLTVTALAAPAAAAAGETIDATDTTKNIGAGSTDESTTRFYFSVNQTVDASDTLLGARTVSPLAGGAMETGMVSLTVPATAVTGTYYLLAKADGPDAVVETSETNNVKALKLLVGPDMIVSTMTAPTIGAAGGTIEVTEVTRNDGGGVTPITTTAFFLSTNTTLDGGDIWLTTRTVPALGAGETSGGPMSLTVPAGTVSGSYRILAKTDNASVVLEVSEVNNVTASLVIKIGPDLTVSGVTGPVSAVRGTTITVGDTSVNSGGAAAGPTTTTYYLSANNVVDAADIVLGSRSVIALGPGASNTGQISVTIPAGHPTGLYYILAKADAGNVVSESSETNNSAQKSISIQP